MYTSSRKSGHCYCINRWVDKIIYLIKSKSRHFSIGFAIAQRLAQEGAKVIISSRKQKNVDAAVEKLKSEGLNNVSGIVCHVSKAEDRQKLFDLAKNLDILVSNAAANPSVAPVLDVILFHSFSYKRYLRHSSSGR